MKRQNCCTALVGRLGAEGVEHKLLCVTCTGARVCRALCTTSAVNAHGRTRTPRKVREHVLRVLLERGIAVSPFFCAQNYTAEIRVQANILQHGTSVLSTTQYSCPRFHRQQHQQRQHRQHNDLVLAAGFRKHEHCQLPGRPPQSRARASTNSTPLRLRPSGAHGDRAANRCHSRHWLDTLPGGVRGAGHTADPAMRCCAAAAFLGGDEPLLLQLARPLLWLLSITAAFCGACGGLRGPRRSPR